MTPVPWIRLYTGFFDHPKTRRLRRELGTIEPIQRLWCWAADCRPDGNLSSESPEDIEESARWNGEPGKCYAAMVSSGFIDVDGDSVRLHGWGEKTGAGIESLIRSRANTAERQKRYRSKGSNALPNPSRDGYTETVGEERREEDPDPMHTPRACARSNSNASDKPPARVVTAKFGSIRAEVCGTKALFWQAPQNAIEKTSAWLDEMPADGVADIEPAIRLACEKVKAGADGWTEPNLSDPNFLFGTFLAKWSALREELHGCAPVVRRTEKSRTGSEPKIYPVVAR